MKQRLCLVAGFVVFCGLAGGASAQRPAEADSPRQQVDNSFDRKAPKVGQPLPDVKLLDADGNEVSLASFRGRHTVLVFGCLT